MALVRVYGRKFSCSGPGTSPFHGTICTYSFDPLGVIQEPVEMDDTTFTVSGDFVLDIEVPGEPLVIGNDTPVDVVAPDGERLDAGDVILKLHKGAEGYRVVKQP